MIFGMGTVFVFLTLLVICVLAMSKIINKFFVEPEAVPDLPVGVVAPTTGASAVDPLVLRAIQEAICQHRARRRP